MGSDRNILDSGEVQTSARDVNGEATIRHHLDCVLNSSHFKNSKRCQSLLRYVVGAVLSGRSATLKERVIGVEALGRDPGYDTTQDAVVRNVAIEVRKRLAQYYQDPHHENGVRIELPAGSYVPEFIHDAVPALPEVETQATQAAESSDKAPKPAVRPHRLTAKNALIAAGLIAGCAIVLALSMNRSSAADRFWAPFVEDSGAVQICVGEPAEKIYRFQGDRRAYLQGRFAGPGSGSAESEPVSPAEMEVISPQLLWRRDAFCAARLAGFLESRGSRFRLRADVDAPYSELRGNPIITIGGFDWRQQLRAAGQLRFAIRHEVVDGKSTRYVLDRQNPSDRQWRFVYPPQDGSGYYDYAIVTRRVTSVTEKAMISIVGATDVSTFAAGEYLVTPDRLNEAFKDISGPWESKNLQMVIQARVIQGVPGPATTVATYVW